MLCDLRGETMTLRLDLRVFERHEDALAALVEDLRDEPVDPFASVPVAVGRGELRRWLRHELATRMGIVAGIDMPPLRAAIDVAVRASLGPASPRSWWPEIEDLSVDPWSGGRLRDRVLTAFRALDGEASAALKDYLWAGQPPGPGVAWRELSLSAEVADVLERGLSERPDEFVGWAEDPALAPDADCGGPAAWLVAVCRSLGVHKSSPAVSRLALRQGGGHGLNGPPLRIVGPTALEPGFREDLEALARHLPVRWFRVVSSSDRWRGVGAGGLASPLRANLGRVEAADRPLLGAWACDAAPASAPPTLTGLLSRVQASLRRDVPLPDSLPASDDTLSFHRTYGPLRQVEALRDHLLRWFADDPTLEPRDVRVLTPDLETYAPLIAAVFARRSGPGATAEQAQGPALPVRIANLGLSRTNPVADALLRVLELAEERVTATRLFELVATPPIKARFGLSDDDVADLRDLLSESNLRWGLDAADRASVGQPSLFQNTVEFGLQRLALGALLPDRDLPAGARDAEGGAPVVPMAVEGRDRARRVAALASLTQALRSLRKEIGEATGEKAWVASVWRARLGAALDDLTETSEAGGWLRLEVDAALDEALPAVEGARMELAAVRRLLRGRFELRRSGGRVITGAITVTRLAPHACIPARGVALLGMDDAAYPRVAEPRAWDPLRTPRMDAKGVPLDPDARAVQRQALQDTLLATSDRVFVAWSGFELRKGSELPPCVPVDELIHEIASAAGASRGDLVRSQPRQPWSPRALNASCFDGQALAAGRALRGTEGELRLPLAGLASNRDSDLPPEEHPITDLTFDQLAAALRNPSKEYLQGRLALYLPQEDAPIADREPITLDHLDEWGVRDELLRVLADRAVDSVDPDDLVARLSGRGILPLQAGGERALQESLELVQESLEAWQEIGGTEVLDADHEAMTIRFDADGVRLTGSPDRIRRNGEGTLLYEWLLVGKVVEGHRTLRAWVHLLGACAGAEDETVIGAHLRGISGKGVDCFIAAPSADDARRILGDLVTIWSRSRQRPLPLFEKSSQKLSAKLKRGATPSAEALATGIGDAWPGSNFVRGDLQDRHIGTLWAGYDPRLDPDLGDPSPPADGLVGLARRVWLPLVSARRTEAASRTALGAWEVK